MSDTLTPQQRHECMSSIQSTSTKPEVKLRHELWKRGYRYRKNDKRLPGTPDIVLPKFRSVIFVHGCFWHGHRGCKKYVIPKTNTGYWINKIARNQERDQDVWRKLEAKGWSVVIVWECELDKKSLDTTTSRVEKTLIENRKTLLRLNAERAFNRQQHILEKKALKHRRDLLFAELDSKSL